MPSALIGVCLTRLPICGRQRRGEVGKALHSQGDVAANAAMGLSKPLGTNPRALAEIIVAKLKEDADVAEVSVAGPGFINIRLSVGYWQQLLATMISEGEKFGRSKLGHGQKVNVEYVSANPTGPMHVG